MCGRYTITVTLEELMAHYMTDIYTGGYHTPRYNIAPSQIIPVIIHDGQKNRLGDLQWGFIPSWAKDAKMAFKMINARAETIMEKPAFKLSFQRKRCLVPADGFYEWKKTGDSKQPMRIVLKSKGIISMAGLYDTWTDPDGKRISTCTIITTRPNELMKDIHDRMPAMIRREDEAIWLDREQRDLELLQSLLTPYDVDEMQAYPVSAEVGNVKNDSKELIEQVSN